MNFVSFRVDFVCLSQAALLDYLTRIIAIDYPVNPTNPRSLDPRPLGPVDSEFRLIPPSETLLVASFRRKT